MVNLDPQKRIQFATPSKVLNGLGYYSIFQECVLLLLLLLFLSSIFIP